MKKHIVLCGGASLPDNESGDFEIVLANPNKPHPNLRYSIDNVSHKLLKNLDGLSRDLLDTATYVYHADNSVNRGTNKDVFDVNWTRCFKFIIPVRHPEIWQSDSIKNLIVELLEFLTEDIYEFVFIKRMQDDEQLILSDFTDKLPYGDDADCVLLFSGGMDSLAGVVNYATQGKKPILASHQSRGDLGHSQKKLASEIRKKVNWSFPQIDILINRIGGEAEETSQRSRSFLYLAFGSLVAHELGLKEVVVAENGVTTFNLPRLGQTYGAHASRSTHPKVIRLFEQLLELILHAGITISTPLIWNTRVDNIRILQQNNCIDLLPLSASCNHSRRPSMNPHCGTCSQCVDRRFAVEYLNLVSLDGELTGYEKNIFIESLKPGEETFQAISPVMFMLDYQKRDIVSFIEEYGGVFDSLDYLSGDFENNLQKIYDLYGRFSEIVEKVIGKIISENWVKLFNGELPDSCLIVKCKDKKILQPFLSVDSKANELIKKIKSCPFTDNKIYEDLCEEVLTFLFVDDVSKTLALGKPLIQLNNTGGYQRRDLVFENIATEGFWLTIRTEYNATGIIVDAKNYTDEIDGAVITDFAGKYLRQKGLGLFGIVVARRIPTSSKTLGSNQRLSGLVKAQEDQWRNDNRMVIALDDSDLVSMIESKRKLEDPTKLIRQRIFTLKAGI
jgi:7-cyano-7-deazaguanine synthase in queuosine biosynthesis